MSRINWKETLGWGDDELEELRVAGYAYLRQGKYEIASDLFEALNVLCHDSAYDAQTLGALYLELGNPAKALVLLDKALKLETEHHAPTLLNVTKAMLMLNRRDEGLKLAKLLRREPDPKIANMARALILAYG